MPCVKGGPGPTYKLPPVVGYDGHCQTKKRNPAYSMGIKLPPREKLIGPGPKYAFPKNYTRFGPDGTPKFSLKHRIASKRFDGTPGPGQYRPEDFINKVKKRAPAHVISGRTAIRRDDMRPSPCDYNIPSTIGKSKPAYSMKFRRDKDPPLRSPGPAAYGAADMNTYMPRAPKHSLGVRRPEFVDKSRQPPFYNVQYRTGRRPPDFSFGFKHSPCKVPLILEEDAYPCD